MYNLPFFPQFLATFHKLPSIFLSIMRLLIFLCLLHLSSENVWLNPNGALITHKGPAHEIHSNTVYYLQMNALEDFSDTIKTLFNELSSNSLSNSFTTHSLDHNDTLNMVKYLPNILQHLQDIIQLGDELNLIDEQTTQQFKAIIDTIISDIDIIKEKLYQNDPNTTANYHLTTASGHINPNHTDYSYSSANLRNQIPYNIRIQGYRILLPGTKMIIVENIVLTKKLIHIRHLATSRHLHMFGWTEDLLLDITSTLEFILGQMKLFKTDTIEIQINTITLNLIENDFSSQYGHLNAKLPFENKITKSNIDTFKHIINTRQLSPTIYAIILPVVSRDIIQTFKLVPFSTYNDRNRSGPAVWPQISQYLYVKLRSNKTIEETNIKFFALQVDDSQQTPFTVDNVTHYLLKKSRMIYKTNIKSCEMSLLLDKSETRNICHYTLANITEGIQAVHLRSNWIIYLQNTTTIIITCPNSKPEIRRFIHLQYFPSNCTILTENQTFFPPDTPSAARKSSHSTFSVIKMANNLLDKHNQSFELSSNEKTNTHTVAATYKWITIVLVVIIIAMVIIFYLNKKNRLVKRFKSKYQKKSPAKHKLIHTPNNPQAVIQVVEETLLGAPRKKNIPKCPNCKKFLKKNQTLCDTCRSVCL